MIATIAISIKMVLFVSNLNFLDLFLKKNAWKCKIYQTERSRFY